MGFFPDIEIPDFEKLSKKRSWDPRLYQPLVYNKRIINHMQELNPGTISYDDFWDEMDYYCYNGFQPKGMPKITGRHFYYLNMTRILLLKQGDKRKTKGNPFYRALDHRLFLELDHAIKYEYGLIVGKPRRVGLSEFGAVNANYELTFYPDNMIGICAGKQDKADDFYGKLKSSLKNTRREYRNGILISNAEELKLGYRDTINKHKDDFGLQSSAFIRTMGADSGAFEGKQFSLCIFEEAGLFQNLVMSYKATEPCFKEGSIQYGIPLVYGTGGEIDKGSKGYKELWDQHQAYNLKPIFVSSTDYYPGDGDKDKSGKKISFFNYKTGVTDSKRARKYIEAERVKASKSKESYAKHIQSYPLKESEIFFKTKGGYLDLVKLSLQQRAINEGKAPDPVLKGKLVWVDSDHTKKLLMRAKNIKEMTKIRVSNDSKVKFQVDENGNCWTDSKPINQNLKDYFDYLPDIASCDSYDDQVDLTSSEISSGALMAYRCFSGPSRVFDKPISVLTDRGDGSYDDDTFYEDAVKFAIYWGVKVLVEYTKTLIIRYFIDVGARDFLALRPEIDVTETHKNEYGLKMPNTVKELGRKLLKNEVKNNIHKCFFEIIIKDLIDFGEKNTDIAMCYVINLIYKLGIFGEISDSIEYQNEVVSYDEKQHQHANWYIDMDGNLQSDTVGQFEIDYFIPERDLSEKEYNEYIDKKNNSDQYEKVKSENEIKLSELEQEAKNMGVDPVMLNIIKSEKERHARNGN